MVQLYEKSLDHVDFRNGFYFLSVGCSSSRGIFLGVVFLFGCERVRQTEQEKNSTSLISHVKDSQLHS